MANRSDASPETQKANMIKEEKEMSVFKFFD